MQCSRCQQENRPGAKFCEECGTPLARSCSKCGSQLSATAKFCPECAYRVAGVTPGGRLASPESYTPQDLLGKAAFEGEHKQVTVLLADVKGSVELAGDEIPMARPSSLLEPPGPTVAATPPISAIGRTPVIHDVPVTPPMAEASEPGRRSSEDTSEPVQVPGIPRIAIGTGGALVALVVVALYLWLPTAPRAPVGDRPAAVVPTTDAAKTGAASEPLSPGPTPDAPARSAPEAPPEANSVDAPALPERPSPSIETSSITGPSTVAASTSKGDLASGPLREPGKSAALGARSAGARDHAEQARSRMTAARVAAERVAAGFYARNRFLSAQTKERDGMAALDKSAYAAASALFAEAQSEYQAATAEAPLEEQNQRKLAALRAGLDQAHAEVAARRQQALAARADQLARELFDQAQAQQVEGDGLASRKDVAAATRAYQEAAARYGEATDRARAAATAK